MPSTHVHSAHNPETFSVFSPNNALTPLISRLKGPLVCDALGLGSCFSTGDDTVRVFRRTAKGMPILQSQGEH